MGQVIALLRKKAGLNQADLAESVGLRQAAWSKVERGETAITVEQLLVAVGRLNQTVTYRHHALTPATVLDLANDAQLHVAEQGVEVRPQRRGLHEAAEVGLLILAGAALGALIGKVVSDYLDEEH